MKKLFDKLKLFIDTWKIWLFVAALFGTNGAQMYAHSELEKESYKAEKVKPVAINPVRTKTIIIHKADNSYCDKLINEHKNGSQH